MLCIWRDYSHFSNLANFCTKNVPSYWFKYSRCNQWFILIIHWGENANKITIACTGITRNNIIPRGFTYGRGKWGNSVVINIPIGFNKVLWETGDINFIRLLQCATVLSQHGHRRYSAGLSSSLTTSGSVSVTSDAKRTLTYSCTRESKTFHTAN